MAWHFSYSISMLEISQALFSGNGEKYFKCLLLIFKISRIRIKCWWWEKLLVCCWHVYLAWWLELRLSTLGKTFSRQRIEIFFYFFFPENRFDISCKLSRICMNVKSCFLGKIRKYHQFVISAELAQIVVKVKPSSTWFNLMFLAHLSSAQDELLWSLLVPRVSVRLSVNIFKRLLLWSRWANFAQISYGASLGWGNKKLLKWSLSVDQDGRHAHIW